MNVLAHGRCRLGLSLAALALLALLPARLAGAGQQGTVTNLAGQATVERAGESFPVTVGTAVEGGDIVVTGPLAHTTMTLVDGSEVRLGADTRFFVEEPDAEDDTTATLFLIIGDLWARIVRTPAAPSRFSITTPTAVVGIRGTELGVAVADDGTTLVAVEEGSVEVASPDGPRTTLAAGEQTEIPLEAEGASLTISSFAGGQPILADWRAARRAAFPGRARLVALNLKERTDRTLTQAKQEARSAERLLRETLKLGDGWRHAREVDNVRLARRLASRIRANLEELRRRVRIIKQLDNRLRGYYELTHAIQARVVTQRHLFPDADRPALAAYYADVEDLAADLRAYHQERRHWVYERVPLVRALVQEIRESEAGDIVPSKPAKKPLLPRRRRR